jgi:hypothetical protein
MKAIEKCCRFLLRSSSYGLIALSVVIFACSSDDKDPEPEVTPPPTNVTPTACKITTVTGNSAGKYDATKNYTLNNKLTYGYDDKGNLISSTALYNYSFSDGTSSTSSTSTSNQFNDEGFVIRSLYSGNSTNSDKTVSNYTRNTDYQYENGRLTKEIHATSDNGKAMDYTFSYEYDSEGRLTKVSSTYNNSYTKYEWSGNKLLKMTDVDAYGKSESPFLEFNADGLLAKSIETYGSSTDEMRYTYDSRGNNIRTERHINAKPSSAWTNEFDGKKNAYGPSYEKFKGHPNVIRTQPEYAPKENTTKSSYYQANFVTGAWELSSSSTYTYDYNEQDFPVDQITKNFDKAGVETSTRRESYEYQGCK